ncbi:TPA: hypothetical protein NJ057_003831 [Vibrio parahaemolyticus]|uniref:hypothetical protein n=1 Tax=Vibrio harveyi group TaxID=717610 RepID=UPI0015DFD137|nr:MULTISPECIES: hypothetical protein [Vibrio harveyi group]EIA1624651.1 hypothetical protein [Vibrio parahaemolyticus]EIZ1449476.1 hypothetical protein [Vibrio parahaemolyticus]EJF4459584.1 hypothetical protein [Vibrio parahaemolyticus]ELA9893659.1 hypothetical protein [Vibrio parahaemolyticus]MBS9898412.1 hypothetical protein [Vibrio alginolyticus]
MNTSTRIETQCNLNNMMVGFNPETGGVILMAPYYFDHYRAVRDIVLKAIPMHVDKSYEYDENDEDAVPPQVVIGIATKIAETLLMDDKLFNISMSAADKLEYIYEGEEDFDPQKHLPEVLSNLSQQACDFLVENLKNSISAVDERLGGTSEDTKMLIEIVMDVLTALRVETRSDESFKIEDVKRVATSGETIH